MEEKKNAYDYLTGSQIANDIEKTQINKFHTKGGTGFAAEEANALNDRLWGRTVDQVGTANTLNGADRIVDGIQIQTKYFDTPSRTVNSAFDLDGNFKYQGQLLEVPSDQYTDCIELMRNKISEGKVQGVIDPNDAENIVKKGDVSYRQAKNIAKAGNINSLIYDAQTHCVSTGYAFAISFTINFAKLKWAGKSTEDAINDSVSLAFQSGATSFITGIATAQILRSKTAAIGVVTSRCGVRTVVQTDAGKKVVEKVAQASLGKAVYGAAATNHVAKLLRSNVVTSVVTTAVITAPDFYRAAFTGSISWAQFSKNLVVNGAGVAGGAGGWVVGAAGGAAVGSFFPIIGTAVGGVVGGLFGAFTGGSAATLASKAILDGLIEDDAKEMIRVLPDCLQPLAFDFLLSEDEVKAFAEDLKDRITPEFLRDMYQSTDRRRFVYNSFENACARIIAKRPHITPPAIDAVQTILTLKEEEVEAAME
ncbi:hypothetical protein [Geomonas paludis]|uniref:Uncharacterized protein n=1 Tax=Geomonas paludis TaxID=2740185 RepID=A0A6V8MVN4_9BACT|nr:hypothetical protein [Geomonas paludis]GFO63623.1 hypothetical protein GMPD_15420 [Geomonas paludis]